jgi:predicted nuclease with RNAse H fold
VYPYAGFVTLLGGTPPPKSTREGLRLRVITLRRLGLQWDDYYDHDSLDALMAAFTAWRFVQGRSTPLGDGRDGSIWLPVTAHELRDKYAPLTVPAAKAALAGLGAR